MTGSGESGLRCRLYGLDVLSQVDLFARRPGVATGADVRVTLGEPVPATQEVPDGDIVAEWSTDSGLTARFVRRPDGSHHLGFENTCDVVVDAGAERVEVRMVEGVPDAMAGVLVSGTVLAYLLMLRGAPVLHASAVDVGGRAVGFVGASGMGKSTLATLMCRDGGRLVTDDVLRLSPGPDGRLGCALGPTEVRLREAASGLAGGWTEAAARARPTPDDRLALSVRPATREGVPLTALLIPRPDRTGNELRLVRVPPLAAVMSLLSFPRILGVRDERLVADQFIQMTDIARTVPVYLADVPWGPPFAPDLASRLVTELDRHEDEALRIAETSDAGR